MCIAAIALLSGCGSNSDDNPSPQEEKAATERASRTEARVILENYIAALRDGDGRAACGLMASDLRAKSGFEERGRRVPCEEAIEQITQDTEFKRIQQRLKVTGALVEGNTVIFRLAYVGEDIAFYDLAREDGRWQIVAIRDID
jgi:Putative lumazine-binding